MPNLQFLTPPLFPGRRKTRGNPGGRGPKNAVGDEFGHVNGLSREFFLFSDRAVHKTFSGVPACGNTRFLGWNVFNPATNQCKTLSATQLRTQYEFARTSQCFPHRALL